jgi:hypothetical protein
MVSNPSLYFHLHHLSGDNDFSSLQKYSLVCWKKRKMRGIVFANTAGLVCSHSLGGEESRVRSRVKWKTQTVSQEEDDEQQSSNPSEDKKKSTLPIKLFIILLVSSLDRGEE